MEILEIPMQEAELILCLPKAGQDINDLLGQDILDLMAKLKDQGEAVKAYVQMPTFTQSSRIELLPILEKMGYRNLSRFQAGYDKLLGQDQEGKISQVLQESKIEVTKDGIEGAAYTKVDVKNSAARPDEFKIVELTFDRPYLYILTSQDLPSFMGINRKF